MSMKLGTVVIVTNAMDPWVETSCRNFLPNLLPLVSTLPVIYARSIFEQQGVDAAGSSQVSRARSLGEAGQRARNRAKRPESTLFCCVFHRFFKPLSSAF